MRAMSPARIVVLTSIAMLAFAGNSLLCRLALQHTGIDPASFTLIRVASGALVLWLIVRLRGRGLGGSWASALALFAYAIAFSFAYVSLSAATGALLLFGAVQGTMIGRGLWLGERFGARQTAGLALAVAGLVALLLPGITAPSLAGSALMVSAGIAWGVYSLRGRGAGDPTAVTAGNFVRAVPFALLTSLLFMRSAHIDAAGAVWAIASGALASGLGYAVWYTALKGLSSTRAATVQLSVPAIAAAGGVLLLGEPLTLRLVLASVAILGGVWLVIAPSVHAGRR
jgi:drug/metabolite transporter (DMT)-like permease